MVAIPIVFFKKYYYTFAQMRPFGRFPPKTLNPKPFLIIVFWTLGLYPLCLGTVLGGIL